MRKTILITGGAGFIGSHVVREFIKKYSDHLIVNADKLTYAGNLENLVDVEKSDNYIFEKIDITEAEKVNDLFYRLKPDKVIHLAAESHVDRSIENPISFVETNVLGTVNLLNSFKNIHHNFDDKLFYHISTDEVYGSLGPTGLFEETTPYDPNSPYSASKAASDHFVRSYGETFGLPFVISNCSNNYGPNQFPEKLIPLLINNIINQKKLPIYGDGKYTRDWLYVVDHARAIEMIYSNGKIGETYNIGGFNEWTNIDLVNELCNIMNSKLGLKAGSAEELIAFVKDRAGHDRRYAIDASKIKNELGWVPSVTFEEGLALTVDWYLDNQVWLKNVTSGQYQDYYNKMYS